MWNACRGLRCEAVGGGNRILGVCSAALAPRGCQFVTGSLLHESSQGLLELGNTVRRCTVTMVAEVAVAAHHPCYMVFAPKAASIGKTARTYRNEPAVDIDAESLRGERKRAKPAHQVLQKSCSNELWGHRYNQARLHPSQKSGPACTSRPN